MEYATLLAIVIVIVYVITVLNDQEPPMAD